MRKLDPEMKCSLPPAKQKKKKVVYLSINTCIPKQYSWSMQMKECELQIKELTGSSCTLD